MSSTLSGTTILMSGGSRGIGLAIALRAARDGANVAVLAKTDTPHPTLAGTVHTAVEQIEAAGGRGLAVVGDVRNDDDVARAVERTIDRFGGIDVVVNNASAIDTRTTTAIDMKRYDLMADINVRGTFLLSRLSIESLSRSANPHILTLSPPLNLTPYWAGKHLAYTMAKYGMSLTTLGLAEELRDRGIGVNSLWPCTLIDTAAIRAMPGGEQLVRAARRPAIMADAAHAVLVRDAATTTGNFFTDEQVLREAGVTDFRPYSLGAAEHELLPDIFLSDGSDDPSNDRRRADSGH
ncbi:short chain dehydrogenase [Tersicoccus solisilvae]|uniref:Short chain dehydrogenase n=1 Tax=Tersicoccus solisilvae TaxID=1882339 RepID=A0ABQ1PMT2_9MICC|nr:NAD(P)-dependent oxidoreductase [Tersicoccus solisilvae]GGC99747.1 short chain dehydrogenase [Tersicoccus solisilvae]